MTKIDYVICAQKKSVSFNLWCNICLSHNLTSYQQKGSKVVNIITNFDGFDVSFPAADVLTFPFFT